MAHVARVPLRPKQMETLLSGQEAEHFLVSGPSRAFLGNSGWRSRSSSDHQGASDKESCKASPRAWKGV